MASAPASTVPSLAGKVFAITGGASGMGLATARRLVHHKAKAVCIGDFNDANFDKVKQELEGLNSDVKIQVTKLDVSKSESVNSWVSGIVDAFGALDGCLNAAGIPQPTGSRGTPAILDETDESWERVMGVNLNGVFYCMRAEIGAMVKLEKSPRSIVNISSMAALRYQTDIFAYCISKYAVKDLTTAVAKDVEEFGIRVNGILPGGTNTPMLMGFAGPRSRELALKSGVKFTLIEADHIAEAVTWLLSEDSSKVTGINMPVGALPP